MFVFHDNNLIYNSIYKSYINAIIYLSPTVSFSLHWVCGMFSNLHEYSYVSACILYCHLAASAINRLNVQVLINKLCYILNKLACVISLIFYPFTLSNNYKFCLTFDTEYRLIYFINFRKCTFVCMVTRCIFSSTHLFY